MKKSTLIILVVIICLIGVLGTIFFLRQGNANNSLSVLEEIRFNEEEREILTVLKGVDNWLQNPTVTEDDESSNVFLIKPSEPIFLKDYLTKIYEARKKISDSGEAYYILDIETKSEEGKIARRFLIYSKSGVVIGLSDGDFDWSELGEEKVEETPNNEGGISYTFSFGASFYQSMLESFNQQMQEEWNSAEKFNHVNYNALIKAI